MVRQGMTILFPLVTIPYVTRVLGSVNFGKVSFSSSIANYVTLFAGLGISAYATVEGAKIRDQKQRFIDFSDEIFSWNVISTLLAYLVLFVLLFCSRDLNQYLYLILIQSSMTLFITLGADWINSIYEDYLFLTIRYIVLHILALLCMFLFVRSSSDLYIYACILAGITIIGNIINIFHIKKNYNYVHFHFNKLSLRHLKPILVFFASNLAISVYVNSDITMITLFIDDHATGIYSIGVKIYTLIKQLIASIIAVSVPRLSLYIEKQETDSMILLLKKVKHVLLLIALPAQIGLIFLSQTILLVAGGQDYVDGWTALSILSLCTVFSVLSAYNVSAILLPHRVENKVLWITSLAAVLNLALNFIFIPALGINGAAITTLIAEIAVWVLTEIQARKLNIRSNEKGTMLPCIVGCVFVLGVCLLSNAFLQGAFMRLAVAFVASVVLYGGVLILLKDEMCNEIFARFIKKINPNKR